MRIRQSYLAIVVVALLAPCARAEQVLHVDDDAPVGGHGNSWSSAFRYLQDALSVARAGDEIRVADGRYRPDQSELGCVVEGDRTASFELRDGVSLLGGYGGYQSGSINPNRDVRIYRSVLTGDLAGDDDGSEISASENSYHVVVARNRMTPATMDGFTIMKGQATQFPHDSGGGLLADGSSPVISRCRFIGNRAMFGGGIFAVDGAAPTVTNCVFVGNVTPPGPTDPLEAPDGPTWMPRPDDADYWPPNVLGTLDERVWSLVWPSLWVHDGAALTAAAPIPTGQRFRRFYTTPAGVFVVAAGAATPGRNWGSLWRSADGFEPFVDVTPEGGCSAHLALHNSITYVGPTPAHPEGVVFFFEYTNIVEDSILFCSTDNGSSWFPLFQCAPTSVRHFHGGIWVPQRRRLYVLTGDSDAASTILLCDDVDDLIANPETWKVRWGLIDPPAGHPRAPVDPAYCANANLGPNGYPVATSGNNGQAYRTTDMLIDGDCAYWGVDGGLFPGQGNGVFRLDQDTGDVIMLAGPDNDDIQYSWGSAWQASKLPNGMKVLVADSEATSGTLLSNSDPDGYCHMYLIVGTTGRVVDVAKWRRTIPVSGGTIVPTVIGTAIDQFWIWWSQPLEDGKRVHAGRLWPTGTPAGGGVLSAASSPIIRNCTFAANESGRGAAVAVVTCGGGAVEPVVVDSCILAGPAPQLYIEPNAEAQVSYSCLPGGAAGVGNIDDDAMFVLEPHPGPDEKWNSPDDQLGDLRLMSESPCILAGDPGATAWPGVTDIVGHPRVLCERVDMGAYEQGTGDTNCDGVLELADFADWVSCATGPSEVPIFPDYATCVPLDINADGQVDLSDFARLVSETPLAGE